MRILSSFILMLVVCSLITGTAAAQDEKFINLSLFNPVQIYDETQDIKGIRLTAFYSKNANVTGFDWGWIALSQVTGNFTGVQLAPINMVGGMMTGWQAGLVNYDLGDWLGLQTSFVNYTKGQGEGVQLSWINVAGHVSGLQLGLFNSAETMYGLQIGLINVIKQGGQFPFFPIVNWSF